MLETVAAGTLSNLISKAITTIGRPGKIRKKKKAQWYSKAISLLSGAEYTFKRITETEDEVRLEEVHSRLDSHGQNLAAHARSDNQHVPEEHINLVQSAADYCMEMSALSEMVDPSDGVHVWLTSILQNVDKLEENPEMDLKTINELCTLVAGRDIYSFGGQYEDVFDEIPPELVDEIPEKNLGDISFEDITNLPIEDITQNLNNDAMNHISQDALRYQFGDASAGVIEQTINIFQSELDKLQ